MPHHLRCAFIPPMGRGSAWRVVPWGTSWEEARTGGPTQASPSDGRRGLARIAGKPRYKPSRVYLMNFSCSFLARLISEFLALEKGENH